MYFSYTPTPFACHCPHRNNHNSAIQSMQSHFGGLPHPININIIIISLVPLVFVHGAFNEASILKQLHQRLTVAMTQKKQLDNLEIMVMGFFLVKCEVIEVVN